MISIRTLQRGFVAGILALVVGSAITLAAAAGRHAGIVVAVDAKAGMLTVDEFGANAVMHRLRLHVAPQARVVLSERKENVAEVQGIFAETPITLADIKPGDFVVVDVTESGKTSIANSVIVTLRGEGRPPSKGRG